MVDALSSGGSECMLVGVQVPPLARLEEGSESLERQRFGAFRFPGKPGDGNRIGNKKIGFLEIRSEQSLSFRTFRDNHGLDDW